MTENDKKLIAKANKTSYIDWYLVDKMREQADSEEAKRILADISKHLYHREEASAGLL